MHICIQLEHNKNYEQHYGSCRCQRTYQQLCNYSRNLSTIYREVAASKGLDPCSTIFFLFLWATNHQRIAAGYSGSFSHAFPDAVSKQMYNSTKWRFHREECFEGTVLVLQLTRNAQLLHFSMQRTPDYFCVVCLGFLIRRSCVLQVCCFFSGCTQYTDKMTIANFIRCHKCRGPQHVEL